jgi:hypothetical protein
LNAGLGGNHQNADALSTRKAFRSTLGRTTNR